ncbi:MAG: c-type cytochrome [Verrucomicrobia bacterium]|nr:c-type cytochrome [Verrucomicrobiota bacterium]
MNLVPVVLTASLTLGAAAAENIRPLSARPGPKPFAYTNAPDAMPNYLAGEKWGTQGQAITQMQLPMTPAASLERIALPAGFQASLFASEPQITKPISLAWDARGRLWIAETLDYPNELKPLGQGRDRIKVCEDTNGDGQADRFTVFADKLSIPTSFCFANGGVIVIESGQTLFLKDTNGDDVADERKVLFSGWGMGDTHATASNLRYGPDNWIWGVVGYSGFDGVVGGKTHKFGMGVFRFKPDGSALEFLRSSNNNTWGLGISEDGIIFGSTANNNASWYLSIPNRYYEAVSGWSASRMETIADSQAFYPVTDKVRQVDAHGRYTAGAGHALYTARTFPQEFWNRVAFVAEPTGHLIGQFRLDPIGADFRAVNQGSFLASDDEWSSPIVAEVGPDGALWVIDWYNYIIQHNPTPIGFQTGKGNAYETPLRDQRHGRIYRVNYTAGKPTTAPKLEAANPSALVAALANDNQLWRFQAQRLLVERGPTEVVPALVKLTQNTSQDAIGLNPGAMHALWTLSGLGVLSGTDSAALTAATAALQHPAPGVRRAAVTVLPPTAATAQALLKDNLLADPDAQVRLATFLALASTPTDVSVGRAVAQALQDPRNATDRWLREAAACAAARNVDGFLAGLNSSTAPFPEAGAEVALIVSRHLASRGTVDLPAWLKAAQRSPAVANAVLDGLVNGWASDAAPQLSDTDQAALRQTMKALTESGRDRLLVLARKWNRLDLFPAEVAAATVRLRQAVADTSLSDETRVQAARALINLEDDAAVVGLLLDQVNLQSTPALANGLLRVLGDSRQPTTGQALLDRWSKLTPSQKRTALSTLLRRAPWTVLVLDRLEAGTLNEKDLGWDQWQTLRNNPDAQIAARANSVSGRQAGASSDRAEVVKQFLPVAARPGDAAKGREVYAANCGVCHLFYGQGGKVGPDLSGIGARAKAEILAEILDPNRSVEANYVLWTVETKSGDTLSGRLDTETQTSIELYDLQGQKHAIQRKDIASLEASNQSIMPTGLEQLGEQPLADLLAFLAEGAQHAKH